MIANATCLTSVRDMRGAVAAEKVIVGTTALAPSTRQTALSSAEPITTRIKHV
jgi:hypothetical protein